MLRPRERRRPQIPNQLSVMVEQQLVAFCCSAIPGSGPRPRGAPRSPGIGDLQVSPSSVYRPFAATAWTRAPGAWRWSLAPVTVCTTAPACARPHMQRRPGELVGMTSSSWATGGAEDPFASRDRRLQLLGLAGLTVCPPAGPAVPRTLALARRVAAELRQAGRKLQRVLTDNGSEFGRRRFHGASRTAFEHTQIRSDTHANGHIERLHRTILEDARRPAFARYLQVRSSGLRRDLTRYLHDYDRDREHHGHITNGHRPADLVTVPARWSRDQPAPVGTTRDSVQLRGPRPLRGTPPAARASTGGRRRRRGWRRRSRGARAPRRSAPRAGWRAGAAARAAS